MAIALHVRHFRRAVHMTKYVNTNGLTKDSIASMVCDPETGVWTLVFWYDGTPPEPTGFRSNDEQATDN